MGCEISLICNNKSASKTSLKVLSKLLTSSCGKFVINPMVSKITELYLIPINTPHIIFTLNSYNICEQWYAESKTADSCSWPPHNSAVNSSISTCRHSCSRLSRFSESSKSSYFSLSSKVPFISTPLRLFRSVLCLWTEGVFSGFRIGFPLLLASCYRLYVICCELFLTGFLQRSANPLKKCSWLHCRFY